MHGPVSVKTGQFVDRLANVNTVNTTAGHNMRM